MKKLLLVLAFLTVGILLIIPMACTNHYSPTVAALLNTPTNTPTVTSTFTPLNTATKTFTSTATNTATYTFTPTATGTPTDTYTITSTNTPTDTATITSTDTPTDTPTATPTPITIMVIAGPSYSTDGVSAISAPITVAVGQEVIWDASNTGHPLYIDDGAGTCVTANNTTFPVTQTFSTPATGYTFHCGIHGTCNGGSAVCTLPCSGMTALIWAQ
jgi:hypothetical protein